MYPDNILPGIDLYLIMLCAGVAAAIIIFRVISDKIGLSAKLLNFSLITGAFSIGAGYYSAVFFQALYNIPSRGKFEITSDTGATFYGGLIGGAACFLLVYFAVGHFVFRHKENVKCFFTIADIASASIAAAHSLGRVGCFFAGCCHGAETDGFFGIYMPAVGKSVVPLQIYEALFLAGLFIFLAWRAVRGKTFNLAIYMSSYGVWRFLVEFLRDDYRGETFVPFLSPSQLTAVFMIIGSGILVLLQKKLSGKKEKSGD